MLLLKPQFAELKQVPKLYPLRFSERTRQWLWVLGSYTNHVVSWLKTCYLKIAYLVRDGDFPSFWPLRGSKTSTAAFFIFDGITSLVRKRDWKDRWDHLTQPFIYLFIYYIYLFIIIFWPRQTACGILVLQPGIKPGPMAVKAHVLTTGPPGNSQTFI